MISGQIKYLNTEKGFGFIQCEEYPKDVFLHAKDFHGEFNDLQKGDSVTFNVVDSPKGLKAENVERV